MRLKDGDLAPLEVDILSHGLELGLREDGFHGYQVAQAIEQSSQVPRLAAFGSIYKALSRLEDRGFVESWWEPAEAAELARRPRRRLYRVSAAGAKALAEQTRARTAPSRWSVGEGAQC